MSFNVHNIAGTPFVMLCVAAIATVPVESLEARIAFWIGFALTCAIFWFAYVPAASESGGPGSAFCCGFLVLAGPTAYGVFTETGRALLGPIGVAISPWVALSVGPLLFLAGRRLVDAKDAARVGTAMTEIASVDTTSDLIPYLLNEDSDVRDAAAKRLLDLAPSPEERSHVLTFSVQSLASGDWKGWHDEAAQRIFNVCLSLGPIARADLLELYATQTGSRHEGLVGLVERELLAIEWGDDRGQLIESARRRAQDVGGGVDAVVINLRAADREAAKSLAELALEHGNLEGKTALIFGHEEGSAMLTRALEGEPKVVPRSFVDAALALPPASGLPLLARILRLRDDLEHHMGNLMDEVPLLFAPASEAPEAAQDLLEAIEALRQAKAGSSWAHGVWTRAAEALRKELKS